MLIRYTNGLRIDSFEDHRPVVSFGFVLDHEDNASHSCRSKLNELCSTVPNKVTTPRTSVTWLSIRAISVS